MSWLASPRSVSHTIGDSSLEVIAILSNQQMASLSADALRSIIRAVEKHIPQPEWTACMAKCDEGTLLKMAFHARECSRHLLSCEIPECEADCSCPHCT